MRLTGGVYVTEEERPPIPSPQAAATTNGTTGGRKRGAVAASNSGYNSCGSGGGFVFVRQEDLFYSQLTVRETLQFTARLRLPRGMADADKCASVEEMLSRMGLLEVGVRGCCGCHGCGRRRERRR